MPRRNGSHSTRVRGLKYIAGVCVLSNHVSHSTRVRGLKLQHAGHGFHASLSHSTRVRGLKYQFRVTHQHGRNVALYTSAWIEIFHVVVSLVLYTCRTLHECVD